MDRGLHFRIGHYRQIDQALGRAPIEDLPDRLVFGLDLFPGRVCRQVDAEQAEPDECGGYSLHVLRLHGLDENFQVIDGRLVEFRRRALQQPAISCSASSKLPLRNSHSARSSRRLNIKSYSLSQSLSSSSAMPAAKYTHADA